MKRPLGIVIAGIAAGSAYLLAQAFDLNVTKNRLDDRVLIGRLVPVPRRRAIVIGTVMHLVNSVLFSAVFRLALRDRLAGPMWWRGLQAAIVETVALYPMALLEDFHPAIRDGQLDSYQTATAFLQQVWRHVAFGAVLGLLTPRRG